MLVAARWVGSEAPWVLELGRSVAATRRARVPSRDFYENLLGRRTGRWIASHPPPRGGAAALGAAA